MGEFKANIVPVLDKATNAYGLEDADAVKREVERYISEDCMAAFVIQSDDDLKAVKKKLAEINKTKSLISSVRKTSVHILTDSFSNPLLELEKALDKAYSDLRAKRDEYTGKDKEQEDDEPKTFSILVSDPDESVIKKVAKYAKERKCSVKEA